MTVQMVIPAKDVSAILLDFIKDNLPFDKQCAQALQGADSVVYAFQSMAAHRKTYTLK